MRERPVIFSGPMVNAILEGHKTQTRRVIKPQPVVEPDGRMHWNGIGWTRHHERLTGPNGTMLMKCPFGQPGDRLWVRETWDFLPAGLPSAPHNAEIVYWADGSTEPRTAPVDFSPFIYGHEARRPSIHMPRWASRITLEIESVRVERLQAISEEDARAEGITDGGCLNCGNPEPCECPYPTPDARDAFIRLWESVNGEKPGRSWFSDPWVWVIEFRQVTQ